MRTSGTIGLVAGAALTAVAVGACNPEGDGLGTGTGEVGAAYTTFDRVQGGCLDSHNGVNCNHYATRSSVYINGGPSGAQLADGTYFFAVVPPGFQRGGFVEGARGNLSDTVAGGTAGDHGSGDPIANRTFTVSGGTVMYSGTHRMGTSPQGHSIIQLSPYDTTTDPGGTFIVAICRLGATSPSLCKFDAFHVTVGTGGTPDGGTPGGGDAGMPGSGGDAGMPGGGDAGMPGSGGDAGVPPPIIPEFPVPDAGSDGGAMEIPTPP